MLAAAELLPSEFSMNSSKLGGGNILGKLKTEVPKSSMRSSNSGGGGGGILGKLRTKVS